MDRRRQTTRNQLARPRCVCGWACFSWIVPFWALAPYIANSLSGLSNPPSVAAVTTAILVVQTIIGLLGFWVAGTQVKAIIKGSTMRHALGAIWSMLIHGRSEVRATSAMIPMNRDHRALTPSCFAVADRLAYPNAVQLRAWSWLPAPT